MIRTEVDPKELWTNTLRLMAGWYDLTVKNHTEDDCAEENHDEKPNHTEDDRADENHDETSHAGKNHAEKSTLRCIRL